MQEDEPLVSVVTPSFNQGEFIEDTLLCVRNQDYPKIEHLVIDGKSNDETIDILKKYEDQYNLTWISEGDNGQADAVNKGFEMAQGEIVGWLNSDDVYIFKDVISSIVSLFEEQDDADVIYGNVVTIGKNNELKRVIGTFDWDYQRLLRGWPLPQPAVFFRKHVVKNNKLKNLELGLDLEYWLRWGEDYNILHVDSIFAGDRIYSYNKRLANRPEHRSENKMLLKQYGQQFGTYFKMLRFIDKLHLGIIRIRDVHEYITLDDDRFAFEVRLPSTTTRIKKQIRIDYLLNLFKFNY